MRGRARAALAGTLAAVWAAGLVGCAGGSPRRACVPCPPRVSCEPGPRAPACSRPAAPRPTPATAGAAPAPSFAAPGTVLDHRAGKAVSFEEMAARLAGARVVYVGESHDQRAHHEVQERILRAVVGRPGGPTALGLEMFSRPQQRHLDAFSRGEIDEEALRERSEWGTRWGFGWEMYRPMLSFARERGVALVALNAPREVTRKIARGGLGSLSEEERATVPPLDLSNEAHRRFVREAFGAHGAGMEPAKFERFYAAQVTWDETMAESAARWLDGAGPASRMVVVLGNGHVEGRHAVPARAERRGARPYVAIVQEVLDPGAPAPLRPDPARADFTVWSAPSGAPKRPARPGAAAPAPAAAPTKP